MALSKQHNQFYINSKDWVVPKNITLGVPIKIPEIGVVKKMKAPTHKIKQYKLFLFLTDGNLVKFEGGINCNIEYINITQNSHIDISWEGYIESEKQVLGILLLDEADKIFANLKVGKNVTLKNGVTFRIRYVVSFNRRAYNAAA